MKKASLFYILFILLVGILSADDQKRVFSPEIEKTMDLVGQLEDHGYDRSAVHYLKKALRTSVLKSEERELLEEKLSAAQKRMSRLEPKVLPDLEVMLHFERPTVEIKNKNLDPLEKLTDTTPDPRSYPSNRINKKKWFWVTVAVVATGAVAYKVTKHLRQKNPSPPNSVTIQF
jgi:hypothetical protein